MKISTNKIIKKNILIAHRGLWNKKYPENSLGAFQNAIKQNFAIELDVHILKDNTLVVFHDDNLKRMTGINKNIKDCTYPELKDLYLQNSTYKIPTLSEVLNLIDARVLVDIEIKTDIKSFRICKEICKLLDHYKGEFYVKSFNPLFIIWFRIHRPSYIRGILVSKLKNVKMSKVIKFICYKMWLNPLCKPDFIAFDMKNLPNKKITYLIKKGFPVFLWTLRNNKEIDKYFDYNGLIFENIDK